MTPYYEDDAVTIYHGDARDILPTLTFDVVVTDPPYEIGYEGNRWDKTGIAFDPSLWSLCLGSGHLLAFGSPRTHHRLMVAIEALGRLLSGADDPSADASAVDDPSPDSAIRRMGSRLGS